MIQVFPAWTRSSAQLSSIVDNYMENWPTYYHVFHIVNTCFTPKRFINHSASLIKWHLTLTAILIKVYQGRALIIFVFHRTLFIISVLIHAIPMYFSHEDTVNIWWKPTGNLWISKSYQSRHFRQIYLSTLSTPYHHQQKFSSKLKKGIIIIVVCEESLSLHAFLFLHATGNMISQMEIEYL